MIASAGPSAPFPLPLSAYPAVAPGEGLLAVLRARIDAEPFNAVATCIFVLAILHTFGAARFTALARAVQRRHDEEARHRGRVAVPSVVAEILRFFGEVEVVFGLWAVVLVFAIALAKGRDTATHYLNDGVNYTEALFVVVIMALTSTRPILRFAEGALRRLAGIGHGTPAAWWMSILIVGPLLGSVITEPGAMTISALLLVRQFYDRHPSTALKYATLGLLFVNVSVGGTLTHFAAPPVLMVARTWNWDTPFMLTHFGWRAVLAIVVATGCYYLGFRRELTALASRPGELDVEQPDEDAEPAAKALLPVPGWVTTVHVLFIAWTVINSHFPALFLGGFLFFLGFARATAHYQSRLELRTPLLVGFFLGGLVIHGGLQGWWISPVLQSLSRVPLFAGATLLTAVNDNALITYLATLVPDLSDALRYAVVAGAVTGGGLTVIANAPNPAGQSLLAECFDDTVSPLKLLAGALIPTLITAALFMPF
jgi:Putative Na+/H+ antiporter